MHDVYSYRQMEIYLGLCIHYIRAAVALLSSHACIAEHMYTFGIEYRACSATCYILFL